MMSVTLRWPWGLTEATVHSSRCRPGLLRGLGPLPRVGPARGLALLRPRVPAHQSRVSGCLCPLLWAPRSLGCLCPLLWVPRSSGCLCPLLWAPRSSGRWGSCSAVKPFERWAPPSLPPSLWVLCLFFSAGRRPARRPLAGPLGPGRPWQGSLQPQPTRGGASAHGKARTWPQSLCFNAGCGDWKGCKRSAPPPEWGRYISLRGFHCGHACLAATPTRPIAAYRGKAPGTWGSPQKLQGPPPPAIGPSSLGPGGS